MKIYSSVFKRGNFIYERGYSDGIPFKRKVQFKPRYWVRTQDESEWTTIHDEPVQLVQFDSIYDAKDFLKTHEDVSNSEVFGDIGFEYQYLVEQYAGSLKVNSQILNTCYMDIETEAEQGFPNVREASDRIIVITTKSTKEDQYKTWTTLEPPVVDPGKVLLKVFDSEIELLRDFLNYWSETPPDILTGWNTEGFDLPYLYNRITKIMGGAAANRLSPWGFTYVRERTVGSHKEQVVKLQGISHLDLLAMYKKFIPAKQESYKLDFIGEVTVGSKKLPNPEKQFKDFYGKHPQMFVEYNIHDVELVVAINNKLNLIELASTLAYVCKVNPDDVFYQTIMWDCMIYEKLLGRNKVIEPRVGYGSSEPYEGAYVKQPIPGVYKWVISEDLNSMYPHIVMQNNMSMETITDVHIDGSVQDFLNRTVDLSEVYDKDLAVCANGATFRRDKQGIIPELMFDLYQGRKQVKAEMLDAERELERLNSLLSEKNCTESRKSELLISIRDTKIEISVKKILQSALKIGLNSGYGTLGTPCFRYYDTRIAEGITVHGQLIIQWAETHVNKFLNKQLKTKDVDYVVYIDTDAIYVNLEPIVNKFFPNKELNATVDTIDKFCHEILDPVIEQGYAELAKYTNAFESKMVMKREIIADKVLWVSKKRYAARVYDSEHVRFQTAHLKVMGLEIVRSTTPKVFRDWLKDAIPVILDGGEDALKSYVRTKKALISDMKPEQIAFPTSVSKLSIYKGDPVYKKGTPIHIRAALLHNQMVKRGKLESDYQTIRNGDRIYYTYLNMPNPIHENVIGFAGELPPEFGLNSYVDYDLQFSKAFVSPLMGMVKSLNWDVENLDKGSLESFFG